MRRAAGARQVLFLLMQGEGSRELQHALNQESALKTWRDQGGLMGGKSWAEALGTSLENCFQNAISLWPSL